MLLLEAAVGTVCAVKPGKRKEGNGSGNRTKTASTPDAYAAGSTGAEAPPDVRARVRAGDGGSALGQSVSRGKSRRPAACVARRSHDGRRRGAAGIDSGRLCRPGAGRLGRRERRAAHAAAAPA